MNGNILNVKSHIKYVDVILFIGIYFIDHIAYCIYQEVLKNIGLMKRTYFNWRETGKVQQPCG